MVDGFNFKVIKRNFFHRNGLTNIELLWVNLFTKCLTSFFIITCAFAVKSIFLTQKYVISFTCTIIFSQFFNLWDVIFWTKVQNTAWFQYKNFLCRKFSFLKILYIHEWITCFSIIRQYMFVQITRAYIFILMKTNECKVHIFLKINFCIRKKTPGHLMQKINTHDHFGKFDIFVRKVTHTGKCSLYSKQVNFFYTG